MTDPLPWLRDLPEPLLLLAVAVTVVVESGTLVGVLTPGASAALAMGALARAGAVHPATACAAVAVSAVVGAQLAYARGRLPAPGRLRQPVSRATELLRRRGVLAVGVAQWVVGARTLTPRLARRAGIGYRRFAAASVPSACAWGATLTTLGYAVAAAYETLSSWFGVGAAALAVGLWASWWLVRGRRKPVAPATSTPDAGTITERPSRAAC